MQHLRAATPAFFTTLFSMPVCAEELPKLTIGGIINAQAGYTSQESAFDGGTRHQGFRNDTEIHFNIAGKSGLFDYGATLELEGDATMDARGEGLNADKTYIWLEPAWGRFELGNNEGAEAAMTVNAATIAKATGGIDGDDEFFITSTGLGGMSAFLIHPDLVGADTGGIAEDASKITFYTPQFSGFQLGLSYTPDQGDGGQIATRSELAGDFENVFSYGLSYAAEWDEWSFETAFVGEIGDHETGTAEDLTSWQFGANLGYAGFHIAGSYGDWDDSGIAIGSGLDTDFWTLGVSYDWDEIGTSLTYLDSDRGGNDYSALVWGAEYALAPGLTPYVDVTFFEADEAGVAIDNDGSVVLIGTYLNF